MLLDRNINWKDGIRAVQNKIPKKLGYCFVQESFLIKDPLKAPMLCSYPSLFQLCLYHLSCRARTTVSVLFWDHYYHWVCRGSFFSHDIFYFYYLLLTILNNFALKSKQTQMFFFLLQKIISSSNQISPKVNTN